MQGREATKSKLTNSTSTDLPVCFPSRTHLAMMTKHICSPARPTDSSDPHRHIACPHHRLRKSSSRVGFGQASPLVRNKGKQPASEVAEPTSPRVTCSGQIRVRPTTAACKSWRSVMEEIERTHDSRKKQNKKNKKKSSCPVDGLGFKKEVIQQVSTRLRSVRLDLRCFGSFPDSEMAGSNRGKENCRNGGAGASTTMFSKWFMVLQQDDHHTNSSGVGSKGIISVVDAPPSTPPSNALLLMRCRSAPTQSWSEEEEEEEERTESNLQACRNDRGREEEKGERGDPKVQRIKESLVVMRYDSKRFSQISPEIAKENRVIGGIGLDPLWRSKSWKT